MALRSHRLAIVLMVLAFPWIAFSSADDAPAKKPAARNTLGNGVFSHTSHEDKIDIAQCNACHQAAQSETRAPEPTSRGHAPCLASGCHIDDFLSTGPRTKKEEPENFAKASVFCAVCHASKSGAPPSRFTKAKANALYESKAGANFHVEMDHHKHTTRVSCSGCHQVDPTSFQLVEAGPGHKECGNCHDSESEVPMTKCASCHSAPGTTEYFTKARKSSDVRVCTADGAPDKPCFKHERTEHRFAKDRSPIECSSCHYMFEKKSHSGNAYQSLADVKSAPMMDNAKDLAHKNCGASGCHNRDVDDSEGKAKCAQCHSKKFMSSSLFN